MFVRRGVTSLANDLIALLATCLLMLSTLLAFDKVMDEMLQSLLVTVKLSFQVLAPIVFGKVAFLFVIATVVEVVRSAVKAVLVCFIQVRSESVLISEHSGSRLAGCLLSV